MKNFKEIAGVTTQVTESFEDMFGVSKEGMKNLIKSKKSKSELGMLVMSILSDAQEYTKDRKADQLINKAKYIIDNELR